WDALLDRISHPAHPVAVVSSGVIVLAGVVLMTRWLDHHLASQRAYNTELARTLDQASAAREHMASLETLKTNDLEQFKAGISGNAQTQKTLFESGLSLQEERRLLEKQLEIMNTSLLINPSLQRIFLMRADQPLQSYLISYIPLRSFGG